MEKRLNLVDMQSTEMERLFSRLLNNLLFSILRFNQNNEFYMIAKE